MVLDWKWGWFSLGWFLVYDVNIGENLDSKKWNPEKIGAPLKLGLNQEMGSQPKNPLNLIRFEVGKNIGFPNVNEGWTLKGPAVIPHVNDVVLAEELVDLGHDFVFVHVCLV